MEPSQPTRSEDVVTEQVGALLDAARNGDPNALDELFAVVYAELKQRAHLQRAGATPTLGTTALVHETYLKLAASRQSWNDRTHFMRVAARAMRHIVIDRARRQMADKRGGGMRQVTLDEIAAVVDAPEGAAETLMALDEALLRLAGQSERLAQVVELRFFGGLSVEETARAFDVSERTIKRDWRLARAFLQEALESAEGPLGEDGP